MVLLKEHLASGDIKGIAIGRREQMLFQLFAEDTGLLFQAAEDNFQAVMHCLKFFEQISWASQS
jgi:hypothetical protein